MVVAAIAEAKECVVVTDNERRFPGVRLLNPLRIGRRKQLGNVGERVRARPSLISLCRR